MKDIHVKVCANRSMARRLLCRNAAECGLRVQCSNPK